MTTEAEFNAAIGEAAIEAETLANALSASTTVNVEIVKLLSAVQILVAQGAARQHVLNKIDKGLREMAPAIIQLSELIGASVPGDLVAMVEGSNA